MVKQSIKISKEPRSILKKSVSVNDNVEFIPNQKNIELSFESSDENVIDNTLENKIDKHPITNNEQLNENKQIVKGAISSSVILFGFLPKQTLYLIIFVLIIGIIIFFYEKTIKNKQEHISNEQKSSNQKIEN